jgi:hypothetical protein
MVETLRWLHASLPMARGASERALFFFTRRGASKRALFFSSRRGASERALLERNVSKGALPSNNFSLTYSFPGVFSK